MIVKVQLSLFSTEGTARQVLMYNRTRSVWFQGVASPDILKAMAEEDKAFFNAKLIDTKIQLYQRVSDQGW